MKNFFNSTVWYAMFIVILSLVAFVTGEIVTFIMLGFIMITLSNIYDKLDDILKEMRKNKALIHHDN